MNPTATSTRERGTQATSASRALRLAAAAAIVGPAAYVLVTLFHPAGAHGNDHPAVFREYALSATWIEIHVAQLFAMVIGLVGIAGIAVSVFRFQRNGRVLALLGAAFAAVSIPAAGVLQAVDGVALKRAVDAWLAAGGAADSARFAAAETVRWLEHGSNAVFGMTQGAAVVLLAAGMTASGSRYPRWLGWSGIAIGALAMLSAMLVATSGFSHAAQALGLARNPVLWIWTIVAGVLMNRLVRAVDETAAATSERDS